MRDWRNRQTRAFKGRMGDRVSSSLTSRTIAATSFFSRNVKDVQKRVLFIRSFLLVAFSFVYVPE